MIEIRKVDTDNKKQVKEFIQFHYDLYKGNEFWVPPFRSDVAMMLNRKKHPFYLHSEADFFTAWKNGKMVGRIAALINRPFNEYHNEKVVSFFLFDAVNNQEVVDALFDQVKNWGLERGMTKIVGPKGFSLFDGYGMLVSGFNKRQTMNMSSYNFPYYQTLVENYGLTKANEFLTMGFDLTTYELPEKVVRVAEIVKKRGVLHVLTLKSRKELYARAREIAELYGKTFENNWEYYPMADAEINFLIDNVIKLVSLDMVKFIANTDGEMVGFLLTFPDMSAAMQRHNGYLTPFLIVDMLIEMKRTRSAALNGVGILEEYRNKGGDALLMQEMWGILKGSGRFIDGEAAQMAESAEEVQREMAGLGLKPTKRHRVYQMEIAEEKAAV